LQTRGVNFGITLIVHLYNTNKGVNNWFTPFIPIDLRVYGYLPSLRWYQIYSAWWQLTAQDINPIAYVPEFAWHNFAHRPGFVSRPVPLIRLASTYLA